MEKSARDALLSSLKTFGVIVAAVFVCEAVVMWLLHALGFHGAWEIVVDPLLLSVMIAPLLSILLIRPLRRALERQRHAEREALESKDAAQHANVAKSEFLAKMSHEIRTPMTAILGYTDLLSGSDITLSDRDNYLTVIRRNGEHLLQLINDILDLSKIEAGKLSMEMCPCDVASVIADVASMMRVRAEQKGISLSVEYTGEFPETIVTDSVRLRQALVNLVGNAVKFTERGGVRIVVTFLPQCSGGEAAVQIQIIDTGTGVPPEKLEKLFEPFAQADISTSRKYGGTGLGLAITRHITALLGGKMTLESTLGQGSTFVLTVPTGSLDGVKMLKKPGEAVQSKSASTAEQSIDENSLAGLRILLAEDGRDNQLLISAVVRKAGAEVEIAENGLVAVEKASPTGAATFDVILIDMQMPEMDGYNATRILREKGLTCPIIALTAHTMTGDKERCLAAGCTDYCSKPINRPLLITTIARHAGRLPGTVVSRESADRIADKDTRLDPIRSELAEDLHVADIIDDFVSRLPGQIRAMREALMNGHDEELQRFAHQLKGAGGGFGYPSLTEAAGVLESAAKTADTELANLTLDKLNTLCRAVLAGRGAGALAEEVES